MDGGGAHSWVIINSEEGMSDDGLLITSSPPRAEGLSLTVEGLSGERAEGLSLGVTVEGLSAESLSLGGLLVEGLPEWGRSLEEEGGKFLEGRFLVRGRFLEWGRSLEGGFLVRGRFLEWGRSLEGGRSLEEVEERFLEGRFLKGGRFLEEDG